MQKINDANYFDYIKNGEAIVICTVAYCKACQTVIDKIDNFSHQSFHLDLSDPHSYNTMMRLKIKKVPTAIMYRDGKELKRAEGTTAILNMTER